MLLLNAPSSTTQSPDQTGAIVFLSQNGIVRSSILRMNERSSPYRLSPKWLWMDSLVYSSNVSSFPSQSLSADRGEAPKSMLNA